jgi:hypothetical protein
MRVKHQLVSLAYLCCALAALGFIGLLYTHLSFGLDEYGVAGILKGNGIRAVFRHYYELSNFRASSLLFLCSGFMFAIDPAHYPLTVACVLLLLSLFLLASFYFLQRNLLCRRLKIPLSKQQLLISSLLFLPLLFFTASDATEVFSYFAASSHYLLPVAWLTFALAVVFSEKKKTITLPALFVAAFGVGCGAENISLTTLLTGSSFLFVLFFRSRYRFSILFEDPAVRKLLFFLIVTALFASIGLTAPGVGGRIDYEQQNSTLLTHAGLPTFPEIASHLHLVFPTRLLAALALAAFWMQGGINAKPAILRSLLKWNLFFCGLAFLLQLVLVLFLFKGSAPLRTWFPFNFFVSLSLCLFFLLLGASAAPLLRKGVTVCSLAVAFVFLSFYFFRHVPKILAFHRAEWEMIRNAQKACKESPGGLIRLTPPPPGTEDMLFYDQLDTSGVPHRNDLFSKFYGIDCEVRVQRR